VKQGKSSIDEDDGIKQEDNKGSNDVQQPGNSEQEDNGDKLNKATAMA
jgi:hypothetical protein